jgi:ParB family chromosome partitioning protein
VLVGGLEPGAVELLELPVDAIHANPKQPRKRFDGDAGSGLAESVRSQGVIQPLIVRPRDAGGYEIVAGERRWRAAREAGLATVPAVVRAADDRDTLLLGLIENVAREQLTPVEEARACAVLIDEFALTLGEVAERVGRSKPSVSNRIRLLDLPDDVLTLIERSELTGAHGRALLMTRDNDTRRALAREALAGGWSVKETEKRAKAEQQRLDGTVVVAGAKRPPADLVDAMAAASDALTAATGHDVKVKATAAGVRAEISFESPAEVVALAELILRRNT